MAKIRKLTAMLVKIVRTAIRLVMRLRWYQRPPWWTIVILPHFIVLPLIALLVPLDTLTTCGIFAAIYLPISIYLSNQMLDYENRPVMVTGCDSGFGKSTVLQLAKLGATVFAACYTDQGVRNITEETASLPGKVHAFKMDVCSDESVKAGAAFVRKVLSLGNDGLWGIVANAGIIGPTAVDNWLSIEHYYSTLNVNLFGVIRTVHHFLPLIMEGDRGAGRVVICSSILGRLSLPASGPYCTSKYAVEGYAEVIRSELFDHNITVHVINPTFYETTMIGRESMMRSACSIWETLDETKRLIYGPEFAIETARSSAAIIGTNSSSRTYEVSEAYCSALFSKHPKTRYMVGWNAQLIWTPLSFMNSACRIKFYQFFAEVFATPKPVYANRLTNKNEIK